MKSLKERKQSRIERREKPWFEQDEAAKLSSDGKSEAETEKQPVDEFENLTIAQLKAKATELGTEVPKEVTLHADILKFVRNLAAFKAADQTNNTTAEWKSGQ